MIIKELTNRGQLYSLIATLLCLLFIIIQPIAISSEVSAEAQDLIYSCPMHPKETSTEPGKCGICGMFLVAQEDEEHEPTYACPMHPEETGAEPGKCSICGMFLVAEEERDDHDISEHDMEHEMAPMRENGKPALFWENKNSQYMMKNKQGHNTDLNNKPATQRLLPEARNSKSAAANQNILQNPAKHTEAQHGGMLTDKQSSTTFICPMHPQIMQHEPGGSCPICGMDLVAKENAAPAGGSPQVFLDAAVIQNMGVRTAKVDRKILDKEIHTQGLVTADDDRLISVHPRTGGWIEKLQLLTEGDRVERKDILVNFYSPWINQAQLEYIEALEEYDETSFEPSKKTEIGAKVDAKRNSLRLLNVMDMDIMHIRNSRKVQNTIQLLAPQGGVITELNVSEGTYVEPYQAMFTIVDLSRVWVMVDIYEHQAPWVRKGQKVEISAPAIPARNWHGVIDYIYPEVDPKTRTLRARIVVSNPDEALLLNMFVKVDITANATKKAVLTVPREAVIITGERETVIKSLGNGHFQPVDVKTGMRGEGDVEILSGLELGDDIVVSGQFLIDSESSLQASFLRMSE